jgi:hypothetical protein
VRLIAATKTLELTASEDGKRNLRNASAAAALARLVGDMSVSGAELESCWFVVEGNRTALLYLHFLCASCCTGNFWGSNKGSN